MDASARTASFVLKVVPISDRRCASAVATSPSWLAFFLEKINREMGTAIAGISPEASDILCAQLAGERARAREQRWCAPRCSRRDRR